MKPFDTAAFEDSVKDLIPLVETFEGKIYNDITDLLETAGFVRKYPGGTANRFYLNATRNVVIKLMYVYDREEGRKNLPKRAVPTIFVGEWTIQPVVNRRDADITKYNKAYYRWKSRFLSKSIFSQPLEQRIAEYEKLHSHFGRDPHDGNGGVWQGKVVVFDW